MFRASIKIDMMPAVRMTQRGKWTARARKYLEFKKQLAEQFKREGKGEVRQKVPLIISFSVWLKHKRLPDEDNIRKTIMDALEYAGIIVNDKWIRHSKDCHVWDGQGSGAVMVELSEWRGLPRQGHPPRKLTGYFIP